MKKASSIFGEILVSALTADKIDKALKEEVSKLDVAELRVAKDYPIISETKSGKHMGKQYKHKNKKFF